VATALAERAPAPEDRVRVPTTVLWGEHEPLYPPAWSDRLGEFYTDFDVQVLEGVGHFTPLEAPQRVAEATVRGLRR
jgi:pimeloyl-ACP methyl ester carboxylesterase